MSTSQPYVASPASGSGGRSRFDAVVAISRQVCREHYLLRLRLMGPRPFPATRPGQFIQLGCRPPQGRMDVEVLRGGELEWSPGHRVVVDQPELCQPLALLRRPFSLAGRGEDSQGDWLEIVHRVVGVGTRWLAELKEGDVVDLIGPLGNAFELPADKSIAMLVGGGVGLPPMFYLAQALRRAGWQAVAFIGAMTRDLLPVRFVEGTPADVTGMPALSVEEFAAHGFPAVVTTNDGSAGMQGLITRGLEGVLSRQTAEQAARTVVFTCGPEPMMHAVAKLAATHGVSCQVCMEQAMACGVGTCQSCVVKIDPRPWGQSAHATTPDGRPWRFKLACTDGPVFDARHVVW